MNLSQEMKIALLLIIGAIGPVGVDLLAKADDWRIMLGHAIIGFATTAQGLLTRPAAWTEEKRAAKLKGKS